MAFIVKYLIQSGQQVFIPVENLRDAIWFAIIAYIAKVFADISKFLLSSDFIYPQKDIEAIVWRKYNTFLEKYETDIIANIIECEKKHGVVVGEKFKMLVYAIMIYEDYNRPKIFRWIEYALKFVLRNKVMTLGIMQVKTNVIITDKQSISIAVQKMFKAYLTGEAEGSVENAIADYNGTLKYKMQVQAIHNILYEEDIPDENGAMG